MNTSGRLTRSNTDRVIAGVCGGIANYLNVDPALVRLGFVLLVWLGGLSPLIYVILWAVLPTENTVGQAFTTQVRENLSEIEQRATSVANTVSAQVSKFTNSQQASQVGQSGANQGSAADQQNDGPATGATRRL